MNRSARCVLGRDGGGGVHRARIGKVAPSSKSVRVRSSRAGGAFFLAANARRERAHQPAHTEHHPNESR
jgi:hypothetical protein